MIVRGEDDLDPSEGEESTGLLFFHNYNIGKMDLMALIRQYSYLDFEDIRDSGMRERNIGE